MREWCAESVDYGWALYNYMRISISVQRKHPMAT
jgi:hypothetical protein